MVPLTRILHEIEYAETTGIIRPSFQKDLLTLAKELLRHEPARTREEQPFFVVRLSVVDLRSTTPNETPRATEGS